MSRRTTSINSASYYGPRGYDAGYGFTVTSYGRLKVLEYVYDFTQLPYSSDVDALIPTIKANSFILDGYHQVIDAFTVGGEDTVNFGFEQPDGTVIEADGLAAAVDLDAAAESSWQVFDGALIGASVGGEDAQVVADTSGGEEVTAGKGVIVLRYLEDYSANL